MDIATRYSGELLVFDYKPKLKIVGTYHALNREDEKTLEQLIGDSDFVAVEHYTYRHSGSIGILPFFKTKFLEDANIFLTTPINVAYLLVFLYLNKRAIKKVNEVLNARNPEDKRDLNNNEFGYCVEVATKMGKDVYFVDLAIYDTFSGISKVPLRDKLAYLWALLRLKEEWPQKIKQFLHDYREQNMLGEIERREGHLDNLLRQGLLVVGINHAMNYQKSLNTTS